VRVFFLDDNGRVMVIGDRIWWKKKKLVVEVRVTR
jgi:hypothetical protein